MKSGIVLKVLKGINLTPIAAGVESASKTVEIPKMDSMLRCIMRNRTDMSSMYH